MIQDLGGKIVLVTGAASGIGRATARAFAAAGARLVLADISHERLAAVAGELGGAVALTETVDVADRAAMRAFADKVHAAAGGVDVLVNNAGVAVAGGILDTSLADWDWLLGVNLYGVVYGAHFFVPKMVERGQGGHVVNISSVFGIYGGANVAAYVASKFAVRGLSQSLRAELAPHRIGVTAICPGLIATDIIAGSRGGSPSLRERATKMFARRGADPAVVAAAIVDAVKKDKGLVPVTREAWTIWALSRAAPSALERYGARMMQKLTAS